MKWLYYTTLGIGAGVLLTVVTQRIYSNARDISFASRRTIDDFYSKLEDAYDAVRRIDVADVKNEIMHKLDDVRQRFNEFDIGEFKENAKDVVDGFAYEVKNIINQIEAQLSSQWLKMRDQTA